MFKGGAHYKYHQVPTKKFDAMMKAESIGKYVAERIKSEHEFEKVPHHAHRS